MRNNNTFWWITLVIWMAGATWWHTCKIKQLCDAPLIPRTESQGSAAPMVTPLTITDGHFFSVTAPGNFTFPKSGSEANFSSVRSEIDSLKFYLALNVGKRLTITGSYSSLEKNTTKWPDLGIARAEGIKEYFVDNGLPADRFVTASQLNDDLYFDQDSLQGGISFSFKDAESIPESKLAESQKYKSIFKPLDLYFNTGSADYIRTEDNREFVRNAKVYLAENKDKKLLLTGHADNSGSEPLNLVLSRKRVESVRRQLISSGLPAAQLITEAKGQSMPKETNETAEGRAANRRVEIVVK